VPQPSTSAVRVKRRSVTALAAAVATVMLVACSSSTSHSSAAGSGAGATASSGTAPSAVKPLSGGSLTYAVDEAEDSLDPAVSPADVTAVIDRNIFDSLVVQTGANTFGPWLATRWTISPDGKTYTFYLKTGVTFQDGTPFNAAAVKASLDHVVNPATKSQYAAALIAAYQSSTAIDDSTVQVNLSAPFSPFLQALATAYLGIQSPAELAKPVAQYVPVGTGPYKFEAWNKNLNVIEDRLPTYNSPPSNAHTGPAYIDKLTFQFISEDATRFGALTSGQVQGIADVPPIDVKTLQANSGFSIQTFASPGNNYNLYLNVKNGPFTDVNVRKAFVESIDVPALIKSVYFGQYAPATNPIGPTTAFYDATATTPAFNVAGAKKLLDQAGWSQTDSAGYRTKDGKELTLVWPYASVYNREERNVVGDGIVAEAKSVGIKVSRPATDQTTLITDLVSGNYAMFDSSFVRASADILRYSYASGETLTKGGGNISLVNVPELDAWLNGAAATSDQATQKTDYSQAQHYVLDNSLVLPLYVEEYRMGASKKLHGITFDAQAFPQFYGAWLSS
jgi:peptide/nickel transport system substrate-binding protein